MYERKGSLFIDKTKRSNVTVDADLTSFVFYIHKNAVHHGLKPKIGDWKYDGFNALLSENNTLLSRDKVINWFGNKNEFINYHKQPIVKKSKSWIE